MPIGVSDRQDESDDDPEQRRLQRLREPLAEQGQDCAAHEDQDGDLGDQPGEIVGRQPRDSSLVMARDQHQQPRAQADQQDPEHAAAHDEAPYVRVSDKRPLGTAKRVPKRRLSARLAGTLKPGGWSIGMRVCVAA